MRLALLFLLLPTPAAADEAPVFGPALIDACLAEGRGAACVGVSVEPCTAATPGSQASLAWLDCADAELRWWQARMEAALAARTETARRIDAEADPQASPPRPSDVAALARLHQSWEALRDAQCRYEELQFWDGTAMEPMALQCEMRMTGAQALYLEGLARL